MSDKYSDMIHLPHKQSTTRKHMSVYDRAAQFAPFAAMTGYDSAISETGASYRGTAATKRNGCRTAQYAVQLPCRAYRRAAGDHCHIYDHSFPLRCKAQKRMKLESRNAAFKNMC